MRSQGWYCCCSVDSTDPLYGPHNLTCINFVRSKLAANCGHGEEQLNKVVALVSSS